jgi:transposase-like protein
METLKTERNVKKKAQPKYSSEMRARAVRMVVEHLREYESEWAAISSIAAKVGCTPETLRKWVRQDQKDRGERADATTAELERIKELGKRSTRTVCS